MAWLLPSTRASDRDLVLGPGPQQRVHAIEYGWLAPLMRCQLYMYRLPAASFTPVAGERPHAFVSERPVTPLGPAEPVDDLLARHEHAGIELRVLDNLWPWWDRVVTTTLGRSGIRLGNARARPM